MARGGALYSCTPCDFDLCEACCRGVARDAAARPPSELSEAAEAEAGEEAEAAIDQKIVLNRLQNNMMVRYLPEEEAAVAEVVSLAAAEVAEEAAAEEEVEVVVGVAVPEA